MIIGSMGCGRITLDPIGGSERLLSEILFDYALENWLRLRKVIAGPHFIEGTWFGAARHGKTRDILNLAIVSIGYQEGEITVHGDTFLKNKEEDGNFHSIFSVYEARKLKFWYEMGSSQAIINEDIKQPQGICTYTFEASHTAPLSFTGDFSPLHSGDIFVVYYEKIPDHLYAMSNPEQKRDALFTHAAKKRWLP